jgi:sulfur-carrier protein
MVVSVICFGAMREYLPDKAVDNRAQIEVPPRASVGQVVDALGAPRALVFSLLVNGVHADLDAVVEEGAEVTLMPPFAGGAGAARAR